LHVPNSVHIRSPDVISLSIVAVNVPLSGAQMVETKTAGLMEVVGFLWVAILGGGTKIVANYCIRPIYIIHGGKGEAANDQGYVRLQTSLG